MEEKLSQSSQMQPGGVDPFPEPILDWIGDAFLILDQKFNIVRANTEASRLFGIELEALEGRAALYLFGGPEYKYIESVLRHPAPAGRAERIIVPLRKDGQFSQVEMTLYPRSGGTGVLMRDVSAWIGQDRKIAELNATLMASQELLRRKNDELNVSLDQMERLNRQLEEMDHAKNEFLAVTSHELRTPLNSIIGFLQLISEGLCENREEELGYIENALASARRLLSMITDVLDIAKIEAGKMTLVIGDVEVEDLFHDVATTMIVQAQRKGLDLTFSVNSDGPLRVRADVQKANQILINLIGNAIKFTARGSVKVNVQRDEARSDLVRFVISDTGIGIPDQYLTRIFDKFIQVDPSSTRKYQGTGLGLTITRNLVEIMGGTIEASSDGENRGSTITFTLPSGGEQPRQPKGAELAVEEMEELLPSTF